MSGQSFSYPLRPGKFIDRGLFVELLQRVDRWTPMRDAVYVGFGGPCMEDHRVIHASLGLKKMISIENDPHVFGQQKFNRPLREIVCVLEDAKNFLDEFEAQLRRAKIRSSDRRILWFDYESPKELIHQLQALQTLIQLANDGDVIRITVNAHAASLGNSHEGESEAKLKHRRLESIRTRFGDFLPEGADEESTTHTSYPRLVLEALKLAALRSTTNSGRTFLPLLMVQYADGQTMITLAGIVLRDADVVEFVDRTGVRKWPYYAGEWDNVERVFLAPHLTLRERLHLDQAIMAGGKRLPARLGYLSKLQKTEDKDILKLYRRYQRFFPRFQHVDI